MKRSWRTTLAGIAGILSGLGLLGAAIQKALNGEYSVEAFLAAVSTIGVGLGLVFAKDAQVTGGTVPATPEAATRVGP